MENTIDVYVFKALNNIYNSVPDSIRKQIHSNSILKKDFIKRNSLSIMKKMPYLDRNKVIALLEDIKLEYYFASEALCGAMNQLVYKKIYKKMGMTISRNLCLCG